jgi:hypothetical protein
MIIPVEEDFGALRSALRAARENEERWMEMSPESSVDSEQMEQWRSTAMLRHREVERIETLLAEMAEHQGSPLPAGHENVIGSNKEDATS